MRLIESSDALKLHYHLILNEKIRSKTFIELMPTVLDGHRNLSFDCKASLPQFMGQNDFIDRLK